MIITNLIGGLGNQMFQFACGRSLSLKNKMPLLVAADQFGDYNQHNGLELLSVFNIDVPLATQDDLASLLGLKSSPKLRRLFGRPAMSWANGKNWCNEPGFDYWSGIDKIKNPVYIHGYWQSESYFSDIADVIRSDFNFCAELDNFDLDVCARMASGPCASIHVRRGDYLKGKFKSVYATLGADYYVKSMQYLRNIFPGINFFVFSDDPEWVVKYLQPEIGPVEVVSHNIGVRSPFDMRLMSMADHHIIANSSFSWWGAWLNLSKDKIVIAPKMWFADGRPTPTLFPSSWIRL